MIKITKIGQVEVEYDLAHEEEANKLIDSLSNNKNFIPDFFGQKKKISFVKNASDNIYIETIDDLKEYTRKNTDFYLEIIHPQVMNSESETAFLKLLLLMQLKTLDNYSPELAASPDLTSFLNCIYSAMAAQYYKENNTKEKIVDFMFDLPEEEKKTIFDWVNKRRRFDLLNKLLDEQCQVIIQSNYETDVYDPFMQNNMETVVNIIDKNFSNKGIIIIEEEKEPQLPLLSKEELDKLSIEYLADLDPTLKWVKIFKEAKEKGKIVYGIPTEGVIWCCALENDEYNIVAPLSGTISDFRDLMHEFGHYIYLKDSSLDNTPRALCEYPSIFLESHSLKFLKKKGYSDEVISYLDKQRTYWTQGNSLDVCHVLQYICKKNKNGPITLESEVKDLKIFQAGIKNNPSEDEQRLLSRFISTYEKVIDMEVDLENIFLLTNPTCVFKEYPYIIGRYLSNKTMENLEQNPEVINTFMNITENIVNETPQTVIKKLNLEATELALEKPIEYTKKEQN